MSLDVYVCSNCRQPFEDNYHGFYGPVECPHCNRKTGFRTSAENVAAAVERPDTMAAWNPDGVPPYAIGSDVWPGLSKVVEELGEALQAVGKLQAYPGGQHPDGHRLPIPERLVDELADVHAAIEFFLDVNADRLGQRSYFRERVRSKLARFWGWHTEATRGA